jgi:hypothetical protein
MRTVCLVPGRVCTALLVATDLLISLKLFGDIACSWVWVLAPLWIGAPVVILLRVARAGRRGMTPR